MAQAPPKAGCHPASGWESERNRRRMGAIRGYRTPGGHQHALAHYPAHRALTTLLRTALVSFCMPWDPMRDLLTMQERLESLFGRTMPGWVPPVDLAELQDQYRLTVELPGLSRDDVHIDFLDGTLTIRGQRPGLSCCPERYQQLERGQGQFSRSFRFATPVDSDAISADLADGVLTVHVPKAAIHDRRIEIG